MTAVTERQDPTESVTDGSVMDDATDVSPARSAPFVHDLIRLQVGRDSRVVVVSDLHLEPVASEVSTQADD